MSEFYALILLIGLAFVYFLTADKLCRLDNLFLTLASELNAQATHIAELTNKLEKYKQETAQYQPYVVEVLDKLTLIPDGSGNSFSVRFVGETRLHDIPMTNAPMFSNPNRLRFELEKLALLLNFTQYSKPIDKFINDVATDNFFKYKA